MSKVALVGCLLLVWACREHATDSSTPEKDPVKASMFGEVSLADGVIQVMDGGIHGVQGHTLVIPPTGPVTWARRLDGMAPNGKAGTGQLELTADETTRVRGWADALWRLAPSGEASFDPPIEKGPPRWVWAIVQRRGEEVRAAERREP